MALQEHLGKVGRLVAFVREGVWTENPDAAVGWRRRGIQATRFVSITVGGFLKHKCGLYAAGLTYFSMLAFVPMLCLLMIFAKVCGADTLAREKINEHLDAAITQIEQGQAQIPAKDSTPAQVEESRRKAEASKELARQAREFANDMFDRIKEMDVKALGWIGFLMLMWTAISTLSQVETSMNEVWEVDKSRPLWQRCALYLFISMILPLLLAFTMSLPVLHVVKDVVDATLGATGYTKWLGEKLVTVLASRLFGYAVSLVFATVAAAFVLKFIPHRKVQMRAAVEGGLLTAVLFGGWMKACTSIGVGIAKSSALYGSFATVPILLAWIYMSWQIVLLGSCMTYAFQCVHSRVRGLPRV